MTDRLTRIQMRLYKMRRIMGENSAADAAQYPSVAGDRHHSEYVRNVDADSTQKQIGVAARMRAGSTMLAAHSQRTAAHTNETGLQERIPTTTLPSEAMLATENADRSVFQQDVTDMPLTQNQWTAIPHEANKMTEAIAELHQSKQILTAAEAAGRRQSVEHSPAIDYDALAEALSRRPVAVYVDKKATAMVLTREMDTQIGNRNIQQLMSMGG